MKDFKEFTLPNRLTLHERLHVPRLLNHDSSSNLCAIRSSFYSKRSRKELTEHAGLLLEHTAHIEYVVDNLVRFNKFSLRQLADNDVFDTSRVAEYTERLEAVTGKKVITSTHDNTYHFLTSNDILYTAIYNLVKNGCKVIGEKGKIEMDIETCSSFPEIATFIPEGALNYNRFTRFSVINEGSFPEDISLRNRLVKRAPRRNETSGFGLYFVKLAAKVLQAPIDIQSRDNKTSVSIYHPHYVL